MTYFHSKKSSYNGTIDYTIKVYVKDDRFKVVLTDFNHSGLSINLGQLKTNEIYATKGIYKKYNNEACGDAGQTDHPQANLT